MKRKFIRNSLIMSAVLALLLMTDLLLKHYLFEFPGANDYQGPTQHDLTVIGIRSYAHTNSTFMTFINIDMAKWVKVLITFSMAGLLTLWSMFSKTKFKVIALSIMVAGILGNSFDVAISNYVKDIFFTPWWDRGTFNLADTLIIMGSLLLLVSIVIER